MFYGAGQLVHGYCAWTLTFVVNVYMNMDAHLMFALACNAITSERCCAWHTKDSYTN